VRGRKDPCLGRIQLLVRRCKISSGQTKNTARLMKSPTVCRRARNAGSLRSAAITALSCAPSLARIGAAHKYSGAVVALAWAIRNNKVIGIPESGSAAYVKENAMSLSLTKSSRHWIQRFRGSLVQINLYGYASEGHSRSKTESSRRLMEKVVFAPGVCADRARRAQTGSA
jgi:hypothetical protein